MLQHEDALAGKGVFVCTDKIYQGLIRVLLHHLVLEVKLDFNRTDAVDDPVCDLSSAAAYGIGHTGDRRVHQNLPQNLGVISRDSWHLLLHELKHKSELIAETEQSVIKR